MDPLKNLIEEIEQLKYELSVTIPQEFDSAVSMGDIRENSDYSAIAERQHFIGVRLHQLLERLESYRKIDINLLPKDAVHIGSIVKARNLNTSKIEYFKFVLGDIDDGDEKYNHVTISSPIGQSMKGKKVKDVVKVKLPSSTVEYKILQITTVHNQ
jgi:transcription elongation factor GreA